jgi:hypothetical protein
MGGTDQMVTTNVLGAVVIGGVLISLALGAMAVLAFRRSRGRQQPRRRRRGRRQVMTVLRERIWGVIAAAQADPVFAQTLVGNPMRTFDEFSASRRGVRHRIRLRRYLRLPANATDQQVLDRLTGVQQPVPVIMGPQQGPVPPPPPPPLGPAPF